MASAQSVTHYQILKLDPLLIDDQQDPTALIKKAYHRALLQNHPDKAAASQEAIFSVDQITQAYNVVSSPAQRASYDASLRLEPQANSGFATKFQTGVENVDLDDLAFDEAEDCWYRSCRCGNDRGYRFREDDLMEAEEEGELMVGCLDCSLWLRVHYAVLETDDCESPTNQKQN
ncbi:uncharacterized protein F5Z01DRAFT_443900 [Emericellopsis atlantica]|uniref:Diphthamide biosynthesis protein 4 n=1 Tax=Emericellopsis atlantica TaxID=2614577 RepID=A0A9P7ZSQ4_9HYPO|nr:uncharacterized protein F5Z01DRAFT_443900 [Emericellopsis atlantica]KAG9256985.1 hypothetical protein F5Z01DRAFT_443900 [Emericellopsis atlantica]